MKMLQLVNPQELTPHTLAVISTFENEKNKSRILEGKDELLAEYTPSKLIDYACKFFGSSLKGRQEGTADVCKITHKAPIAVNPSNGMYFFPTASPSNPNCSWIAHSHIEDFYSEWPNSTTIVFKNGIKITVPVSNGIIANQIQRTAQFRYLLDHRLRYVAQSHAGFVAEPFA